MSDHGWAPYVPVAERRRKAEKAVAKQRRQGQTVSPVVISGRAIATTFWGKAWCENLEHYSDYANRLPRGRTYVRNGSVVDLQIAPGLVTAQVSGSSLYRVRVEVQAVPGPRWQSLCQDCGSGIASLVELLQGRFSQGVMARLCLQGTGLFPAPKEIRFSCSCPDSAYMCKHVAAVLYGIGARLDAEPELLFRLRGVDGTDLLAHAAAGAALAPEKPSAERILAEDDLSALFGLEMAPAPAETPAAEEKKSGRAKPQPRVAKAAGLAKAVARERVEAPPKPPAKPKPKPKPRAKPKGRIVKGVLS